jgi:putative membrane protein
MRFGITAAAAIGFAIAVYLVFRVGLTPVLDAVRNVGIGGFAIICGYALALIVVLASGWYALFPAPGRKPFTDFLVARQIRDSASDVLPFSQLGGIFIGARALSLRGVSAPRAFASAATDVTTELVAQIVFIAIGVAFCAARLRGSQITEDLATGIPIGIVLMVPGIALFIGLQRRGGRLAEIVAGRWIPKALKHAEAFNVAINDFYRSPQRLASSSALHLAGWLASGVGTWITISLMGGRISVLSAIAIEAILSGARSAFVFVPGALGVQEIAYASLAPVFGLPQEIGLAASLLKRARELTIGIPVLLAWQAMEGQHAFSPADEQVSES